MKKIIKTFLFFSMMIASFVGVSANKDVEVVNAALTKDYTNLTYEMGSTTMPSGYILPAKKPAVIKEVEINETNVNAIIVTDGGASKFPWNTKESDVQRFFSFKIYEDVEVNFGAYKTSDSEDKLLIVTEYNEVNYQTFSMNKKEITNCFVQFTNVPSEGKEIYVGGGSSSVYLTHVRFGEVVPKARFDAGSGTFSDGSSYKESIKENGKPGDLIDAVEDPTHPEGREFLGWATTRDATTANATTFVVGETYYAVWGEPVAQAIHIVYNGSTSSTSISLKQGSAALLTYQVAPANTSAGTIKWSSSNTSVVTVSENGYIEAVGVGEATITVTGLDGKISDTLKVTVQESKTFVVTFIANDVTREVTVYEDNFVEVPSVYQNIKGYEVEWYNGSSKFNPETTKVNSNMTLTGKLIPNGYATDVEIIKGDSKQVVQPGEQIDIKNVTKLEYRLYRKDGSEVTVFEPVVWHSSQQTTIEIDQDGNLTAHKMGEAQIYLTVYGARDKNTFTSELISVVCTEKNVDGVLIDTSISIEADKGYFETVGDNEYAARFIGVISSEYVKYIISAKMEITAIDYKDEVIQTYVVDITTFYSSIEYQSKTPNSVVFKKTWSEDGKVGAAVTITKIPYYSFKGGRLTAKFTVVDSETRMDFYTEATLNY